MTDRLPDALPAGAFAPWLRDIRRAIAGEADADVPCGSCVGCCSSSQFVLIAPDESDALANIPAELLFPAPRMPKGHMLMGYDEHGRCPMLIDGACSIYAHRPRTCRTYDCRVLAAAGVADQVDDKPLIAERAVRWRFAPGSPHDEALQQSVRAASAHLQARAADLPADVAPLTPTHVAVAAVVAHELFVDGAVPADEQLASRLRAR